MPIYEYECTACAHRHEVIQKFSDPLLIDCPECGASKLKKLVSAAGFRLKGSGWYETDFKKDNKRNIAGKDKADDHKSTDKTDKADKAKSETVKPAKSEDTGSAKKSSGTASTSE